MLDLDPLTRIFVSAILWAILLVFIFKIILFSRHRSTGLPLAFALNMSLVHVGAIVHLTPGYNHHANAYLRSWQYTTATVADGIEVSLLGLFSIFLGVLLADAFVTAPARPPQYSPRLLGSSKFLAFVGFSSILLAFAGSRLAGDIPGLSAMLGGFSNLFTLGACGVILHFAKAGQPRRILLSAAFAIALLVGTQMVTTGILGDSIASAITIIGFWLALFRPTFTSISKGIVSLFLIGYVAIFLAVGWIDIRDVVRASVWSGDDYSERINTIADAISNSKIMDSDYQKHLEYMDMRMNQNVIIGKTVETLNAMPHTIANGETLILAIVGWVPRAIWPEKPMRGGSSFASTYTGVQLASGTTFGTGAIFEFYINFLLPGVLLGGICYGFLLRWLDFKAGYFMYDGDIISASPYFAAGATMVTAMNSMFFIVNSAVTAAIAGLLTAMYWRRAVKARTGQPQHRRYAK